MNGYVAAVDYRVEQGAFEELGRARRGDGDECPWSRVRSRPRGRVRWCSRNRATESAWRSNQPIPSDQPDLSVTLHRDPAREWIGLDAVSTITAGSGAMTTTTLLDREGPIGIATQTLLAG